MKKTIGILGGISLASTIQLLISQEECPIPVLDTLTLHAQAPLDYALENE